jgi:hypothetical protein
MLSAMGKKLFLIFLLVLSCQGPWSYYPDNPENYAGIWTNAYIISGRPVENICFDKMHALKEVRMPKFAFYDEAAVKISGSFNGEKISLDLSPMPGKPNCFVGPGDLLADADEEYKIDISMVWDSAGRKVTSNFYAETYIPKKFKIQKAYDLTGKEFKENETIQYLPPPLDLKAAYFIPDYSDDVAMVQVTMVYNEYVYWGENSIDKLISQFIEEGADTAQKAKFGDREHVWFARNQEVAGNQKDIDSIPIVGITMPAQGQFQLLFYATTNDYARYRDTYLSNDDSRVQAVYNIKGGAGIFAGMLVDTFNVHIEPSLQSIKTYSYKEAQSAYCRTEDRNYNTDNYKSRRQCVEIWDSIIWCEIYQGRPEGYTVCAFSHYDSMPWYEIKCKDMKRMLSMSEIITWCEHRDFPIDQYELCGSAMVKFSEGKNSPILEREVKKWLEMPLNDPECAL